MATAKTIMLPGQTTMNGSLVRAGLFKYVLVFWSSIKMKQIRLTHLLLVLIFASTGSQNKNSAAVSPDDNSNYVAGYIQKNRGKVIVEIPEVFELANIAIAISDEGLSNPNRVNKKSDYYKRVLAHFMPYWNHPLIAESDLNRNFGYQFRDNSICFIFQADRIAYGGLYPDLRQPNLFKKQRALVEDFAKVSNFRKFYRDNLSYYQGQIRLYKELVPIRTMWTWVEERFPARHDCYKVVFSPLLGSSHETCRFDKNGYSETIMFVSGPGQPGEYSSALGRALLARVVFTEIDHNYVNPVTAKHTRLVNEAMAELSTWNGQEGYRSAEMTFNEYMTWAVFLLYASDTYDSETFEELQNRVVNQMIYGRKFIRFREFTEELLKLYRTTQSQSIPSLYPAILSWAQAEASKHYDAMGYLDDEAWMIVGPFDNRDNGGFDIQYSPEKEIDFTKEYAGAAGKVKWFRPDSKQKDGFVNLAGYLSPNQWTVAYACAYVDSPEARQVQFRTGSDDGIKVWLNGRLVLSRNIGRYASKDQDIIPVSLKSGGNQILLKVSNHTGSWGFYMRITNEAGQPYGDLRISPSSVR
jgi:hypothetical protein